MADFAAIRPAAAPSIFQHVSRLFAGMAEGLRSYQTYRLVRAELEMLNDRELADLGIARSNIGSIAAEAAQR
ncbi:DUF1127 domain-containing protein [Mangrovicoccus ximenensis]|uniref:DUF1127 domain-containing protein n=1 Tax=Mangrovicoccus ximenensis TaxID=1911570 RepID=UPI00191BF243|nr:DUF1127 domain-containing protein [Mangrovicoccus ximenensis]